MLKFILLILFIAIILYQYFISNNFKLVSNKNNKIQTSYTDTNSMKSNHENSFVYIDLGAKNGNTIHWFVKTYPARQQNNCIIYAFEANPQNTGDMISYKEKHPELNLHLIHKAAWIHSNGVNFTLDNSPNNRAGGSMFNRNQKHLIGMGSVLVESVDFPLWISENVSLEDMVLLKMDIEGAEYDIIDKMIKTGGIKLVDTLVIEWHNRFMHGFYTNLSSYYVDKIKEYDIELIVWS